MRKSYLQRSWTLKETFRSVRRITLWRKLALDHIGTAGSFYVAHLIRALISVYSNTSATVRCKDGYSNPSLSHVQCPTYYSEGRMDFPFGTSLAIRVAELRTVIAGKLVPLENPVVARRYSVG